MFSTSEFIAETREALSPFLKAINNQCGVLYNEAISQLVDLSFPSQTDDREALKSMIEEKIKDMILNKYILGELELHELNAREADDQKDNIDLLDWSFVSNFSMWFFHKVGFNPKIHNELYEARRKYSKKSTKFPENSAMATCLSYGMSVFIISVHMRIMGDELFKEYIRQYNQDPTSLDVALKIIEYLEYSFDDLLSTKDIKHLIDWYASVDFVLYCKNATQHTDKVIALVKGLWNVLNANQNQINSGLKDIIQMPSMRNLIEIFVALKDFMPITNEDYWFHLSSSMELYSDNSGSEVESDDDCEFSITLAVDQSFSTKKSDIIIFYGGSVLTVQSEYTPYQIKQKQLGKNIDCAEEAKFSLENQGPEKHDEEQVTSKMSDLSIEASIEVGKINDQCKIQ